LEKWDYGKQIAVEQLPKMGMCDVSIDRAPFPLKEKVWRSIATGACEADICDDSFLEKEFNQAIVVALGRLVKSR